MRVRHLAACAFAPVLVAGPLPAGAAGAADGVSQFSFGKADRSQALAYWTPERIRKADSAANEGATPRGQHPWKGPEMKTVGRLFFVNDKGEDTWCTATSVSARNRSVALTAAHCVQVPASPGNHHVSMVFVPGYHKGARPYGTYAVRAVTMPRSWEQDAKTDVAALVLDTHKGRRLADAVGAQQVAFPGRPAGRVTVFGYPDSRPEQGEQLVSCDAVAKAGAGHTQSVACGVAGGASGGPWLAHFDARTGKGTVAGLTSFGDTATNSRTTSAELLGPAAERVYERAQGL
ncbi:trypsin-like serine protease [Streptomyces sp. A7024]|uniref:Trypsin-like serine protease n=1 Tax=Streptomyces coryli TaxID=1128680 RepID=A0A6G4TU31_9ACTN|nr:trypsin-like serine protease [Streptomyces coryli]NGN63529.1 trypsin-like serine protease [Streptomyces coryli]